MNTLFQQNAAGDFTPVAADILLHTAAEVAEKQLSDRPSLNSPDDLKPLVKAFLADKDHELHCVAYLDVRLRLIEFQVVSEGSQMSVKINTRKILRTAIDNSAMKVLMIHNHPGGIAEPSDEDLRTAVAVAEAFHPFEVYVMDNWVVCAGQIYSFNEHRRDLQRRVDKLLQEDRERNDNPFAALFRHLEDDR